MICSTDAKEKKKAFDEIQHIFLRELSKCISGERGEALSLLSGERQGHLLSSFLTQHCKGVQEDIVRREEEKNEIKTQEYEMEEEEPRGAGWSP